MTANGFAQRRFRSRRRPTAAAFGRVAREVVAAEALDRDDAPGPQVRGRGRERRLLVRARCRRPGPAVGEPRPAGRAGHRLRVEAAVRGIGVLGCAGGAQREVAHGGPRAVVRQLVDDRGARPAVRAVGERVPVAAVARVGELGEALVAGGDVRREEAVGGRGVDALVDREDRRKAGRRARIQRRPRDALHVGARRRVGPEASGEGIERVAPAGSLDLDPAGRVPDPPREAELRGEAPDEGPEPYALDDAVHDQRTGCTAAASHGAAGGPGPLLRIDGCAHAHRIAPQEGRRTCRMSPERRPSGGGMAASPS